MLAVNDAHRAEGAVFLPPQGLLAVASSAPVNVAGTALYNYTEGYGSYPVSYTHLDVYKRQDYICPGM